MCVQMLLRLSDIAGRLGCQPQCARIPIMPTGGEPAKGKIVVSDNVSLDGVIQDPAGDEGFRVGGWVGQLKSREEVNRLALGEALGAEALLLGRPQLRVVRYAVAIPQWGFGGQDKQPAQVRRVVDPRTSRLEQLDGTEGQRAERGLKAEAGVNGEIVVWASFHLVHKLMEHDLVDELRLKIYPGRARSRGASLRRDGRQERDAPCRHPDRR